METISAKVNNDVVKSGLDILMPEDKQYCDHVFDVYSSHSAHVNDLLRAIELRIKAYQKKELNEAQQFFSLREIDKATEALKETLISLTELLVRNLENYFAKKYCLVFTSIITDKESIHHALPIACYSIIENILLQVGSDLLKAGKEQIKTRFFESFYNNNLPELKGHKISIPRFISINEHWGERYSLSYEHNTRIENLINALNLFLHESPELPQEITSKLLEWKGHLNLQEKYPVFNEVSFKFFKNRRIDVVFTNPKTARKFWNYYRLEVIDNVIKNND